jgi:hypothetical protein
MTMPAKEDASASEKDAIPYEGDSKSSEGLEDDLSAILCEP